MNNLQTASDSAATLAASLTRAASQQTFYTVRWLVDRERAADAFRAYGYFRWLDDQLDQGSRERSERIAFAQRQKALLEQCYRGETSHRVAGEESMLVDLIRRDREKNSGLQAYLRHMMAVMEFDAERRGRLISQEELASYTHHLAVAVTEALHYFIGHGSHSPRDDTRYLAAAGAHVAHILRDTRDDVAAGYFNIPREYLESHHLQPDELDREAYHRWVRSRVQLARTCFRAGRSYLTQVQNLRCRLAGYAYIARFEGVLETMARDDYRLRATYAEGTGLAAAARVVGSALWRARHRHAPAAWPRTVAVE